MRPSYYTCLDSYTSFSYSRSKDKFTWAPTLESIFIMGRMHAPGKGISQSALPYRRSVPTWLKLSSGDVKEQIFKLAKKGLTPSQIGVILR